MINQIVLLALSTAVAIVGYFVKSLFALMQETIVQMKVQTEINRQVQKELEGLSSDVKRLADQQSRNNVAIAVLKGKK